MSAPLIDNELKLLHAFALFVKQKGYNAVVFDDAVIIKDVANKNNNFKVTRRDDYYEYSAKCMIYILLAEFNKSNGDSTHLHLNFKVDL